MPTDPPTVVITDEQTSVVTIADPATVIVQDINNDIDVVTAGVPGPPGATGAVGPTGPQGPPGTGGYMEFDQLTATTVWTINHNLNAYPVVTVIDSAGTPEVGDVFYIDTNNLTITFTNAFAGKALLVI